jgi:translation elongation factor EF-Tu-like GTPase
VVNNKLESEKMPMNRGTARDSGHGRTPLAAAIAEHFAKKQPVKSTSLHFSGKTPREGGQGALIAFWQCYHLNNIMVKCILYRKERGPNGK